MYKALLDLLGQDQPWRQYFRFARMLSLENKGLDRCYCFYLHYSSMYSFCSRISVCLLGAVKEEKKSKKKLTIPICVLTQ